MFRPDLPQTPGVYLGLFPADTCIYATHCKECYVLRKLQRGLSAVETWCKRWNIIINEDKTQAPLGSSYIDWTNNPFVNHVKLLGVIFSKSIKWRLYIERIEAKAFRTFIRIYSLLKIERLSANIKLTLHKALIRSVMT
jgi:hypothetical protein